MRVRDIMTADVELIGPDATLEEAARLMAALDCGFLPVRDAEGERLCGVIADRDPRIRGIARGLDPSHARVTAALSDAVLYCFADDDVEEAAVSMARARVWRLVVLDDPESKELAGIVSPGDMARHDRDDLVGTTARGVEKAA